GNIYVQYNAPFLKGLTARTSWGGDFRSNETSSYVNPTTYSGGFSTGGQGSYARGYGNYFRIPVTRSLPYQFPSPDFHILTLGVYDVMVNMNSNSFSFTVYGLCGAFPIDAGIIPGNATIGFIPAVGGAGSANALLSYFGDVKYSFKNRYFVDINGRRD